MAPPSVKTSKETDVSDMEASGTTVGHLFSSISGCPTLIQCSPKDGASSVDNRHPYSVMQTAESDGYAMDTNDVSWNEIEYFLDTPLKNSDQNGPLDWGNQLISVDDGTLDTNWSDLLVNSSLPDSEPMLPDLPPNASSCQPHFPQLPHHPLPSVNGCPALGSPNASSSKTRMRWTPELHEAFVDSVNKLGGCERATPKGVLMLMNVEGLTIYHVKSHLQKYRTARFKPESPEGTPGKKPKTTNDMPALDLKTTMGITEALRIQMEVQKQLHEQLEIQRTLQIRIEEQGKRLQEMFEQQRKLEEEKGKASSSNTDRPQTPTTEKQPCISNDKSQSPRIMSASTKESALDVCISQDESKRTKVDETATLVSPHES